MSLLPSYRAIAGWAALVALLIALWQTAPPLTPIPTAPTAPRDLGSEELLEARVRRVVEVAADSSGRPTGKTLHLEVLTGSLRGRTISTELPAESIVIQEVPFRQGDRVLVSYVPAATERQQPFVVVDFVRRLPLLVLTTLFIGTLALVTGWHGVRSLAGIICAFGVLRWFIVPHILAGREPLLITLVGCVLIVAVALPLSQTAPREVVASAIGMIGGLAVAGLLTVVFVAVTHISGLGSSEDLALVQVATDGAVSVRGLLLAGMLIGAVGALIDGTAGQAATVFEVYAADRRLPLRELYRRGMNVGRVHIGAMVNTLVIAYAGASLPLLVLFVLYADQLGDIWNREVLAVEVVRALVGSLGILVAVPLTTWTAAIMCHVTVGGKRSAAGRAAAQHQEES